MTEHYDSMKNEIRRLHSVCRENNRQIDSAKAEVARLHALNRELILQNEELIARLDKVQKELATETMRLAYVKGQLREQRKVTS